MPKKKRKLPVAEIRRRQRQAGLDRKGPRVKAKKGDRLSDKGYRQPHRYKGNRDRERNRGIVEDLDRGVSASKLAEKHGLAVSTIEWIGRYYADED